MGEDRPQQQQQPPPQPHYTDLELG
ncbi:hypothetical protein A2U01_0097632, partial [Trifolium medium]|nr:hypothetical protein [Trifolium medium]